jgi:phosphatidylinositol glycan class Q protein
MLMSDGLLRVFWPYDLPRSTSPGVIVGWRNSELDLFVLSVLEDVEVCCRMSACVIKLCAQVR